MKDNYNGVLAIAEYKISAVLSPKSQQHVAECVLLQEIKGDIEKKLVLQTITSAVITFFLLSICVFIFRITADRFTQLSREIVEYFPSECAVSYKLMFFLFPFTYTFKVEYFSFVLKNVPDYCWLHL